MEPKFSPYQRLVVLVLMVILMLTLLCSCGTVKYVPVETVKTEYKTKYERDSIYIDRLIEKRGDTTYITRLEWRYKLKIDSFIKIDSIPVIVEVTKEVNRLTKAQTNQIIGFWGLLFAMVLLVGFKIMRWWYGRPKV